MIHFVLMSADGTPVTFGTDERETERSWQCSSYQSLEQLAQCAAQNPLDYLAYTDDSWVTAVREQVSGVRALNAAELKQYDELLRRYG